jgi:hypothetical protein
VATALLESKLHDAPAATNRSDVFWQTTITDRNLSSITQAGLVNN